MIVKTVSTTQMVDLLCQKYGLHLEITPVGFKYIADWMMKEEVLVGGEESGGLGIIGNIPERDGILINLLLIELMAKTGKTLGQLMEKIWLEIGRFYYDRHDLIITNQAKDKLVDFLQKDGFAQKTGLQVLETITIDGFKYLLPDDNWIMIRPSGTENVVRIYCEAREKQIMKELINEAEDLVKSFS